MCSPKPRKREDYIHLYSGVSKDLRVKRDVSIVLLKNLKENIKSWDSVNEKIIKMVKTIVNFRRTNKTEAMRHNNENNTVDKTKYNLENLTQDLVKFLYKLRLLSKLKMFKKKI